MPEFRMPSLGADMEQGTLLEWLIKPGDVVHRGEVVAVVDTDKAAVEVECFADGTVTDLVVAPGERARVGAVLAHIGEAAAPAVAPATGPATAVPAPPAVAPTPPPAVAPPPPEAAPPAAAVAMPARAAGAGVVTSPLVRRLARTRGVDLTALAGGPPAHVIHREDVEHAGPTARAGARRRASPLARRLAVEAGLDLAGIGGTGHGGAITADDVTRVVAERAAGRAPAAGRVAEAERAPTAERVAEADHAESMRQAVAALMDRSNREIPHYYLTSTIDMTAAVSWLRDRNRELPVEARLVPAALLLKATALAAREVAALNGWWVDGGFRPSPVVDLGIVVSLRRGGIMVPVVHDAPARSVDEVMAAVRDLVQRARTGRLRGSDLSQPSITVSNLGDQGVESVLGVIYPPQVALIGFGAVVERPWAVDGMLAVRPVVIASLAGDHRASDGAIGARLLNAVARLLQTPEEL